MEITVGLRPFTRGK